MADSTRVAEAESVKWFLVFYHDGEHDEMDHPELPTVDFWQPDRKTAEAEGERVLRELIERGDCRNWTAAAHPDPIMVAKGKHRIAQWLLHTKDIAGQRQAV